MNTVNRDMYKQVYRENMNIYAMLKKHKDIPEEVVLLTCEGFLKNAATIKKKWAWFEKALKMNYHSFNAKKQIVSNHKGQANVALLKQLGLLGGGNESTDTNRPGRCSLCKV